MLTWQLIPRQNAISRSAKRAGNRRGSTSGTKGRVATLSRHSKPARGGRFAPATSPSAPEADGLAVGRGSDVVGVKTARLFTSPTVDNPPTTPPRPVDNPRPLGGRPAPERGNQAHKRGQAKTPHVAFARDKQPLHVVFLGLTHGVQRRTVSWSTDRTETPNTVPRRHRPPVWIGPQDIGSSDSTNDAAATRRSASA